MTVGFAEKEVSLPRIPIVNGNDVKPMKATPKKTTRKSGGKKMLERAGLAVKHEFYLEASWILSALFEKKLVRMLRRHSGTETTGLTFLQLLKRARNIPAGDHPLAANLDGIRAWKNQRNDLVRDLPVRQVSQERIKRLALKGIDLYRELNRIARALKTPSE